MKRNIWSVLFCTFIFLAAGSAKAELKLSVVGAYLNNSPTVSSNVSTVTISGNSGTSYGGGALLSFGLSRFMVETGALYVQRKAGATMTSTLPAGTLTQTMTFTDLQIPLMLRMGLLPMLNVGVGVVYNIGMGNISLDQTDPSGIAGGNFTGKSESYSQAQDASSDLAAAAGVQLNIPLGSRYGLLLDGNYQFGITNLDTSGNYPLKVNVIQVLAGLNIAF